MPITHSDATFHFTIRPPYFDLLEEDDPRRNPLQDLAPQAVATLKSLHTALSDSDVEGVEIALHRGPNLAFNGQKILHHAMDCLLEDSLEPHFSLPHGATTTPTQAAFICFFKVLRAYEKTDPHQRWINAAMETLSVKGQWLAMDMLLEGTTSFSQKNPDLQPFFLALESTSSVTLNAPLLAPEASLSKETPEPLAPSTSLSNSNSNSISSTLGMHQGMHHSVNEVSPYRAEMWLKSLLKTHQDYPGPNNLDPKASKRFLSLFKTILGLGNAHVAAAPLEIQEGMQDAWKSCLRRVMEHVYSRMAQEALETNRLSESFALLTLFVEQGFDMNMPIKNGDPILSLSAHLFLLSWEHKLAGQVIKKCLSLGSQVVPSDLHQPGSRLYDIMHSPETPEDIKALLTEASVLYEQRLLNDTTQQDPSQASSQSPTTAKSLRKTL